MTTGRHSVTTWVDLQLAGLRWLVYLATAFGYLLVGLFDPERLTVPALSAPVLILVGSAVLYNAVVTGLAYAGLARGLLPAGTILVDLGLVAWAYYLLGASPDLLGLVVDPLLLMAFLPVITAAVRFSWSVGVLAGLAAGTVRAILILWEYPDPLAPTTLLPALFGVIAMAGIAFLCGYVADVTLRQGMRVELTTMRTEVRELRAVAERAEVFQQITSTLGVTLNFERVLERSLDVAEQAMADWGAKGQLTSIVFLFNNGQGLRLAGGRKLSRHDLERGIDGQAGIVARCLEEADTVVTEEPRDDPELAAYTGVADCSVAAAIPLRAGFENFGAMVFATSAFPSFDRNKIALFSGIADRATIALHNALLFQKLETEKDRIIQIEEDARRKLSRDLHDGPTQSVSAIAMRLNFVRKVLQRDPERMREELEIIEKLARQTVVDIRQMLFTLRPLVLETQGLIPALHALVEKIQESEEVEIHIKEADDAAGALDPNQAGVVFYIVEEVLSNARKYAQASLIEIRLWLESGLFATQVRDNGVGFDAGHVLGDYELRGSLGMINMRERAELINGSLDVKSTPGKGSAITLVVPTRDKHA